MASTTTNVIEGLKYSYGVTDIQYIFNQESPTYNMLGKEKKPVGGRGQFLMPLTIANAGAIKGIAEGGTLPTALAPDLTEATFALQEYVGMYDLTWKLIQDSRSNKFAFQQAVTMLGDGIMRRFARNLNGDLIGDGRGALGVLPAADDTSPITVNSLPIAETGMVVDVMASSDDDTKRGDSLTVTGVDVINRTIKTSGSLTSSAANDYFVIEDTCDINVSTVSRHAKGLRAVINNANPATVVGNIGGIDRTTAGNEFWQSVLLSNGGTLQPLSEDRLLQAMDLVAEKGGGRLKAWLSNRAIQRRYHEMLAGERYFALSQPGSIGGGIGRKDKDPGELGQSPYEFSGIPWYIDPFFAANVIIGMDTDHFFLGVGDNDVPRPISEVFDNIPFFRQTTSATFEVAYYFQMQLLTNNPAAGCQIQDVAEA